MSFSWENGGLDVEKEMVVIMVDVIILVLVFILIVFAIRGSVAHFKGEGACCGGSKRPSGRGKRLDGPVIGMKVARVSGMRCQACARRVEDALDALDGVSCHVDLEKGVAEIRYDRNVDDALIRRAVTDAGYEVLSLQ